jgi:hypothetical protein
VSDLAQVEGPHREVSFPDVESSVPMIS